MGSPDVDTENEVKVPKRGARDQSRRRVMTKRGAELRRWGNPKTLGLKSLVGLGSAPQAQHNHAQPSTAGAATECKREM